MTVTVTGDVVGRRHRLRLSPSVAAVRRRASPEPIPRARSRAPGRPAVATMTAARLSPRAGRRRGACATGRSPRTWPAGRCCCSSRWPTCTSTCTTGRSGCAPTPPGSPASDAVVAGLQLVLVDGRAYPLFGLLFGYGLGPARGAARGRRGPSRRPWSASSGAAGWWLVAIGVAHVVLLWSGDIVAAYGAARRRPRRHGRGGDGGQPGHDGRGRLRARRRPRRVLGLLAAPGPPRCRRSRWPTR